MKALKSFLKIVSILLAAAIVLFVIPAGAVLEWPGLVVNDQNLARAREYYLKHYVLKTEVWAGWRDAHIEISSQSLFKKTVTLTLVNPCFQYRRAARSCFDSGSARVSFDLAGLKVRVDELGPISFLGGDADVYPDRFAKRGVRKSPGNPPSSSKEALPSWLADARIEPLQVQLKQWDLHRPDGDLQGAADLTGSRLGGRYALNLTASGKTEAHAGALPQEGHAEIGLTNPGASMRGPWTITVAWKYAQARLIAAEIHGRAAQQSDGSFAYSADAKYRERHRRLDAALSGTATARSITAKASGVALRWVSELKRVEFRDCKVSVAKSSRGGDGARIQLDCPLEASGLRKTPGLPTVLSVRARANVALSEFPPSASDRVTGDASAELNPKPPQVGVVQPYGSVRVSFAGVPRDFPKGWKLDALPDLTVRVDQFKKVVKLLRRTKFAVPSPFHALRGPIMATLKGKFDLNGGTLPVTFESRLAARYLRLFADGLGNVKVERAREGRIHVDLTGKVALNDVRLTAPRLSLAKPPRFFPDSRIVYHPIGTGTQAGNVGREAKAKPKTSVFLTYDVQIVTPTANPIRVTSNLADEPVPVRLDVELASSKPLQGSVQIESVPVTLFKRKATVDHLNLDLTSGKDTVDGLLVVKNGEYTIQVALIGTLGKTRVKLTSDPPLPENQLVAMLLFGRPLDELNPDQSASVGQARAVFTDGAIGLASFFFLSSTPIQSLGYDPQTGQVVARVNVGGGTALNLGVGGSSERVGVSKRLGPHWAIRTDVGRATTSAEPGAPSTSSASAYLEWHLRY